MNRPLAGRCRRSRARNRGPYRDPGGSSAGPAVHATAGKIGESAGARCAARHSGFTCREQREAGAGAAGAGDDRRRAPLRSTVAVRRTPGDGKEPKLSMKSAAAGDRHEAGRGARGGRVPNPGRRTNAHAVPPQHAAPTRATVPPSGQQRPSCAGLLCRNSNVQRRFLPISQVVRGPCGPPDRVLNTNFKTAPGFARSRPRQAK